MPGELGLKTAAAMKILRSSLCTPCLKIAGSMIRCTSPWRTYHHQKSPLVSPGHPIAPPYVLGSPWQNAQTFPCPNKGKGVGPKNVDQHLCQNYSAARTVVLLRGWILTLYQVIYWVRCVREISTPHTIENPPCPL